MAATLVAIGLPWHGNAAPSTRSEAERPPPAPATLAAPPARDRAGTIATAAEGPADELAAERQRLDAALSLEDPAGRAAALAELVRAVHDSEVKRLAYRALATTYATAVAGGAPARADVEAVLADGGTPPADLLAVGYGFAVEKRLESLAARCLAAVPTDLADADLVAQRWRLDGTLALARGDAAAAQRSLAAAALAIGPERDPLLYARLGDAQRRAGKASAACGTGRRLYRVAPLLPAARDLLGACSDPTRTLAGLDAERHRALLDSERRSGSPLPVLSLEDDQLRPVDVDLARGGKVTVLVFFSTWCPHCGLELPRVVSFARALAADRRRASRVDVLGVRTAIEREREPYEAFAKRHGIAFPVLTDPTLSLAFTGFSKAIGRAAALPAIVVVDGRGVARFVLEPGDYRDTAGELAWAVEALVP